MKISIIESLKEVILEEYQEYVKIMNREDIDDDSKNKRVFALFTGFGYNQIENVSYKDYKEVLELIAKGLNKKPKFQPTFFLDGTHYGFINNFDEITKGELMAMSKYQSDISEYHSLMAVLFRPIIDYGNDDTYVIEAFDNTFKRAEIFKKMPMHIVDGALVFFLNLQRELKSYIQRYTKEEQVKV